MKKTSQHKPTALAVSALAGAALLALGAGSAWAAEPTGKALNKRPAALRGPIQEMVYDGVSDDLLTAGLGKTGLMSATAPTIATPGSPTAAELRRLAIYSNYRGLVDYTSNGGMGRFYGPNIDTAGGDTLGEGKVAGREYIVWADDGSGKQNVTLMVQVPDSFNPAEACIVTATSSGSRGVYGAIGTAGEWGLKHGCAVAYTDKGTGTGLHDLMSGKVMGRDGVEIDAATAGIEAIYKSELSGDALAAFNTATPNRVAMKHAHSQQNPERYWGRNTLDAVRFAFYVLNERYGTAAPKAPGSKRLVIRPANTIVIASSVSNGGGAALAAAEQDTGRLIDGVAVSEPNAQTRGARYLGIRQGDQPVQTIGLPLADYFTLANVYQPCALLSSKASLVMSSAFWPASFTTIAQNRCAALAAKGLVTGSSQSEWADQALAVMQANGYSAESNFLHQSLFRLATNAIAVTYVNAAGRFSVADSVCGYSFANTNGSGDPVAQNALIQSTLFSTGNGVPPSSGVNIVWNGSVGGPKLDFVGVSPSTGLFDFSLDGALCLRSLVTGKHPVTGAALTGDAQAQSLRVQNGIHDVKLHGNLRGKPTLIVAGRSDGLLPVNHTARAYFIKTQQHGDRVSHTRYIEVTNGQHFDSFLAFGALLGYDTRYVPLHPYFNRVMDAMYAHLKHGTPLPPSQVVRTTPRASSATPLDGSHVPAISVSPASGDLITVDGKTLVVPD